MQAEVVVAVRNKINQLINSKFERIHRRIRAETYGFYIKVVIVVNAQRMEWD